MRVRKNTTRFHNFLTDFNVSHATFIIPLKLRAPGGSVISRVMSTDMAHTPLPQRIRMEPFQIFSLQRRAEVEQQNPTLSNSGIISLLGRMWRTLPQCEKEEYMELAVNVTPANRPTRRRRQTGMNQPFDDLLRSEPAVRSSSEELPRPDACPQFSIIPRGSSGTQAAHASHHVVFPAPQPDS
jgi:hypothetical protein